MERTKLLELTDNTAAFDLMDAYDTVYQYAGLFGDNGGDPNGNAWFADASEFPKDLISKLLKARVAQTVSGYAADYNERAVSEVVDQFFSGEWCGYGSQNKAYFTRESDARICQKTYDEMQNDDDLDTIAGRVHAI